MYRDGCGHLGTDESGRPKEPSRQQSVPTDGDERAKSAAARPGWLLVVHGRQNIVDFSGQAKLDEAG